MLGFVPEDAHVVPHLSRNMERASGQPANLDWLFE
jgi:hypothetical protein